jgi:hypothetical protein
VLLLLPFVILLLIFFLLTPFCMFVCPSIGQKAGVYPVSYEWHICCNFSFDDCDNVNVAACFSILLLIKGSGFRLFIVRAQTRA